MRRFPHTTDLYAIVHAKALSKYNMRELNEVELQVLGQLFTQDRIITDSPFVTTRVAR